jgi:hypothetical protein
MAKGKDKWGQTIYENVLVDAPVLADVPLKEPPVTLGIPSRVQCDVCKRKFISHGTFAHHFAAKHQALQANPHSWKSYAGSLN